jgi:uncharacterized protein YxjI
MILFVNIFAIQCNAQQVNWIVYADQSPGRDFTGSVCESDRYVYVVGADSSLGDLQFRIEKRLKSNGELVKEWTYNPLIGYDMLYGCVIINNVLYAVGAESGKWVVLKVHVDLDKFDIFEQELGRGYYNYAKSIVSDGHYLYIAGIDYVSGDDEWRVEKRTISDLSLIKAYTSNPSKRDNLLDIGVNPVTGELWIVGSEWEGKGAQWRVEILSKDLDLVKVIELGIRGDAYSITFDRQGNAYVVGSLGVVKFDKFGNELKMKEIDGESVLEINGKLYVLSGDRSEKGQTHIYVNTLDNDLNVIGERLVLSMKELKMERDEIAGISFIGGKMTFDNENIYAAGNLWKVNSSYRFTHSEWVIVSIKVLEKGTSVLTLTTTTYTTRTAEETYISVVAGERTSTEMATPTLEWSTHTVMEDTVTEATTLTSQPFNTMSVIALAMLITVLIFSLYLISVKKRRTVTMES